MAELKHHQRPFLAALADGDKTARELGQAVFADDFPDRTRSASAAQNAWWLIRSGYATRTLKWHKLYIYSITDAGRAALDGSNA